MDLSAQRAAGFLAAPRASRSSDSKPRHRDSGRHLLILHGLRILSRNNSQVRYGRTRIQMMWHRLTLPDTSSNKLDNLVGTDLADYAHRKADGHRAKFQALHA